MELGEGFPIDGDALRLGQYGLSPMEAEPRKILLKGLHKFRTAAIGIEIVVAQEQLALALGGTLGGDPESAGVTEVEEAGRRWGEAATIERWIWVNHRLTQINADFKRSGRSFFQLPQSTK